MNELSLLDAHEDLYQRTRADAFLASVNIVKDDVGETLAEIEKSLGMVKERAGKIGACIVLLQPIANTNAAEVAGAILDTEFTFRVLEDPTLNKSDDGTKIRALTICRRLVGLHHLYHPAGVMGVFVAKTPAIVPVVDAIAPVAYEVAFTATESGFDPTVKVTTPVIAPVSGAAPQTVTLTCGTAGASIYYTTDGSYPSAVNPNAFLYSAPFVVGAAAVVRAGAFASGKVASDVNAVEYS